MINLKFNNIEAMGLSNMIAFSRNLNIVSITSTATKKAAYATLNVGAMTPTDIREKESKIVFNGYTITGTDDMEKVNGRYFFRIGNVHTEYCAISIINAFKSIPELDLNYNFTFETPGTIKIYSKNAGIKNQITITSDNLDNLNIVIAPGTDNDELAATKSCKIYLDLYASKTGEINGIDGTYEYVTTLQKEYYSNNMKFDISPILSSISEYNKVVKWKANVYAIADKEYINIGVIDGNFITEGYKVNQCRDYLMLDATAYVFNTYPALNANRGKGRSTYNNTVLYIYEPEFYISLYNTNKSATENVIVKYLESDGTLVRGAEQETVYLSLNKSLNIYKIPLTKEKMRQSYYIDLQFSFGIIRLNVITPPNSIEKCTRVYWYNSYGGISLFDFTGKHKEQRTTNITTYEKNLLDYYDNNEQEKEIIYARDNKLDVTLTTHLIDENGTYYLNDLMNSYKAWVMINDVKYYIIVKNIDMQEVSKNVYTVSIKYNYSITNNFD